MGEGRGAQSQKCVHARPGLEPKCTLMSVLHSIPPSLSPSSSFSFALPPFPPSFFLPCTARYSVLPAPEGSTEDFQAHAPLTPRWAAAAVWSPIYRLPRQHSGKELICQCRRYRRRGLDPWVSKIQEMATHSSISLLENPTDRGAWWATVHGVTKSRTRLGTHAHSPLFTDRVTCSMVLWKRDS